MVITEEETIQPQEQEATPEEVQEQEKQMEEFVQEVQDKAKIEALENLTAEQELAIAQNFITKQGKKFMGSEGKYPFLSEAVNSGEEKLKRVSNLQQWEIEKVKVYNRLSVFLKKVGMDGFAKSVDADKDDILKLSTSKEGMLLGIAGTEAVVSKSTQTLDDGQRGRKK